MKKTEFLHNAERIFLICIVLMLSLCGCGNSFFSAEDYLTGPVNGIGLKSSTSLVSGGTEQLYPVVSPPKTSNKSVTWTSSGSSVVAVDSSGLITAVAAVAHGETKSAVITATTAEGGYSTQCAVTVVEKPVPVTGVTLNKNVSYLLTGNSETLRSAISPSAATNQKVTWSSSNSLVASVNQEGTVTTGTNTGQTTITVTTEDGSLTASCLFYVSLTPVQVTGVSLNKSATIVAAGKTETLFATISPYNSTNQNITWSSDNPAAASVNAFGIVTGISDGTANITVTTADGNYTGTCAVSVVTSPVAVTGVSLTPSSSTIQVGKQATLTAAVTPANATNQNLSWQSSNSLIATVDSSGLVTGLSAGGATITVTTLDGGYSKSCSVTVTNAVTYSVIYNANNASGTVPASQSYLPGATVVVRNSSYLTKTNYSFAGWSTTSTGSVAYTAGSEFTMGSSDITLYAVWSADPTYTVTYDGSFQDGGTVPADPKHYLSGSTVTVLGNTEGLYRNALVFKGWYINSSQTYNAGDTFMIYSNVTLYAKWLYGYGITYDGNGSDSGTVPVDTLYAAGDSVPIKSNTGSLARTGYLFQGWHTSAGDSYYPGGNPLTMSTSGAVLYASWGDRQIFTGYGTINIYGDCTVTVKAWGGGGQGGYYNGNTGGGGGYSYSAFTAENGDVLHVVVGAGGGNTKTSGMPGLGESNGYQGGDASLVVLYRGGLYNLKCCAGGGGGSSYSNGYKGGAGGGSYGQAGTGSNSGGGDGNGGAGYSGIPATYGSNMLKSSATLEGLGGKGGRPVSNLGGSGGGGYGGGGTSCYNLGYNAGSGGGGYCEGTGYSTLTGTNSKPGNSTDSDLPSGYAIGGAQNTNGGNGYVIVSIVYN